MLQRLILLGIDASTPQFERRNVSLVNILSITFFLFVFFYHAIGVAYYEKSLTPVFICFGTYQAGLLAALVLNWRGKTAFARHLFIADTLVVLTITSLVHGPGSLFHFYLLSGFFSAYYVYPRSQRHYSYAWVLLFFLAFCVVEFWQGNPLALNLGESGYLAAIKIFTVVGGISSINLIKATVSHHLLQASEAKVEEEQRKVDQLLNNTLPAKVVTELKEFGASEPRIYSNVTVFFSDIVDFTGKASQLDPRTLIDELNAVFTGFDLIFERHHCERIKTIGDAYLAVCGINQPTPQHCSNVLKAAGEAVAFMKKRNSSARLQWKLRVGIHTGMVVGGIVGVRKYIFDVFGDTINTTQRMESLAEPMRINVSEAVYLLEHEHFMFTERSPANVKGKGEMRMFWLEGEKDRSGTGQVDC